MTNAGRGSREVADEEISIFEVVDFLRASWKIIFGAGVVGVMAVAGYWASTPPQFEAKIQVEMAQVRNDNSNNINALGVSVESPYLLAERLAQPSTYTPDAIRSCGVQDGGASSEAMANLVKVNIPNNLTTVAEIVVRRDKPESAARCATAVFEMMRAQQAALIEHYLDEGRKTLAILQSRLKENQDFIIKTDKAGMYQAVYFARRDQMLYLMDQISTLERTLSQTADTRLIAPVYASSSPVSPKKGFSLLAGGALAGMVLGMFLAAARKLLARGRVVED